VKDEVGSFRELDEALWNQRPLLKMGVR